MAINKSLILLLSVSILVFSALGKSSGQGSAAIHEQRFVKIGGIDHWVSIRGENRENPVVLFIHGGPGNPMSAVSESVYHGWEKEFTLVHYDQRGSGKTYGKNMPVEELSLEILQNHELTLDLLVADGVELARFLIDYLRTDQLILTGTSWGSALAVYIYQSDPGLFSAYIGLSQLVNYEENLADSYCKVLEKADEKKDHQTLEILHSMGRPPWTHPRNPGKLRRVVRKYEEENVGPFPDLTWAPGYDNDEGRAAYYAGEEFSWVKFVGLKGEGFANQIDLFEDGLEFAVPVVIIQGALDLFTTPGMSKRFFDQIKAPAKQYILIPKAGHDPNISMLEAQIKTLREICLEN